MNTNTKPYEASRIKEALCKHFNMPSDKSDLTTHEKRFFGLGGHQIHYYYFTLKDSTSCHRAFGKIGVNNEREHQALEYLMRTLPAEQRHIGRPIALVKEGDHSLLLLEYLEGYSNALTLMNSLRLFPNRTLNMARMGKDILDKLYSLQKHSAPAYRAISAEDTRETPGQPRPIGVLKQLDSLKSLSAETKQAIRAKINLIIQNQTLARRGIVHGALGMRNIMMGTADISFIDWEFMQYEGLCVYDACYVATMMLMKGVQLFASRSQLDVINDALYDHISYLEESLTDPDKKKFVPDSIWFARCIAMLDTLWQYENSECGRFKGLVGREGQKTNYLAYRITRDVESGNSNAGPKRRSHWTDYIKDSKPRSSSATATAKKFIAAGGISRGSRVADLGCGHGRITELLVDKVPDLDVVGVDMTQHLLDNFSVKSGTNGSRIELMRGDVTKLPLKDGDFDVAVSSRVFQYLPNPLLAVREAVRILKPGGVVVVTIPNKLNPIRFFNYKHKLYSPFQVRDWFKSCGLEDIEYGSMCFFPSSVAWNGIGTLFETAGKIPLIKYLGGNLFVKGRKKLAGDKAR